MEKTTKTILIALLVVLAAGSQVFASRGGRGRYRGNRALGPGEGTGNVEDFKPGPEGFGRRGRSRGPSGRGGHRRPGHGVPILRALPRLNLTEQQHEQVESILDESRENMQAAHENVREAMQTLHQAVGDEADVDTIRTAAAEIGQALGDEAVLKVSIAVSIKDLLTEEQLEELEELKAQAEQRAEEFRPRRSRRGPRREQPDEDSGEEGIGRRRRRPRRGRGE